MVEINRFCAECGSTNRPLHDNFCQNCYWHYHSLAEPSTNDLDFTICNECYSVKLPSGWTVVTNINDIPFEIAQASVKYLQTDEDTYVDIEEITPVDWTNPKPEFQIKYKTTSDKIKEFDEFYEFYDFNVSIGRGICKVCVAKKTGSSSTVVQLRAKNRPLTQGEITKFSQLALNVSQDKLTENPTAYLSDIIENHGGLDFYFGNQWTGENFISELQKIILGHKEKNFKLITEDKKGQRVYAITFLYRIPEVRSGDLIAYQNELYNVINLSRKSIKIRSLVDRSKLSIYDWNSLNLLRILPEEIRKVVLSKDYNSDTYLFMDVNSFENEEVLSSR
ncbi:MAG: NMD3-related protein, partial [Candidatus Heimdallarchaeota archaeon]